MVRSLEHEINPFDEAVGSHVQGVVNDYVTWFCTREGVEESPLAEIAARNKGIEGIFCKRNTDSLPSRSTVNPYSDSFEASPLDKFIFFDKRSKEHEPLIFPGIFVFHYETERRVPHTGNSQRLTFTIGKNIHIEFTDKKVSEENPTLSLQLRIPGNGIYYHYDAATLARWYWSDSQNTILRWNMGKKTGTEWNAERVTYDPHNDTILAKQSYRLPQSLESYVKDAGRTLNVLNDLRTSFR